MKFSLFFFALLSSAVDGGCLNGKSYTCDDGEDCGLEIQDGKTTYPCVDNSTCTITDGCSGTTTTTSSASELLGVCAAVAVVAVSVVGAIY